MSIRHIVLFRFYQDVDEEHRMQAIHAIETLRDRSGIIDWRFEASLDQRKGVVVAQNVLFATLEDFEGYRDDPRHVAAGLTLAALADWLVADYEE
jgi:hypothetical protein